MGNVLRMENPPKPPTTKKNIEPQLIPLKDWVKLWQNLKDSFKKSKKD